jgi:hypothetical protein
MGADNKHYLSWQNQTLGPHSVEEIKAMLSDRKIHSLFKVQSDEGEVLVREFLAGLNDERKRATSAEQKALVTHAAKVSAPVPELIPEYGNVLSERVQAGSPTAPLANNLNTPIQPAGVEPKFGYAVTSLVLSLLFVLPLINLVSWVMSLIFGFIFLFAAKGDRNLRGYSHAWCGVWLTFIFGSFYVITCFGFAIAAARNPYILIEHWLPIIHGYMIGGAIAGSVVSGLLIAATRMLTGASPKTGAAFVAGTLGVMVGITLNFLIGIFTPEAFANGQSTFLVSLTIGLTVFLIQGLAWSQMIQIRDSEKLGFARALIVSLFCSICQLFIVFVLIVFAKTLD